MNPAVDAILFSFQIIRLNINAKCTISKSGLSSMVIDHRTCQFTARGS